MGAGCAGVGVRACCLAITALLCAAKASAQDIEPRMYANTPVGVNFLIGLYGHSDGGVTADPSVPLTNAEVRTDGLGVAFARSLDLWGLSGKFDASVVHASTSGSAEFAGERRERDVSGWMDPRVRLSVNFYGAPALGPREFSAWRQDLIVGASLQVTAPWGQYDGDKLLNNGTNRWSLKPEFGVSKALGRWTLELAAAANFIGDNDDFLGGKTLEQDPVYSVQGHVIYGFASGIWIALDGNWYTGGRTHLDGVRGDNLQKNTRVGLTLALPVNERNSVKLYGSTGVTARTGSDFDALGIGWQYRWGAGF